MYGQFQDSFHRVCEFLPELLSMMYLQSDTAMLITRHQPSSRLPTLEICVSLCPSYTAAEYRNSLALFIVALIIYGVVLPVWYLLLLKRKLRQQALFVETNRKKYGIL